MTTMLAHCGNSGEPFGWLLEDVPKCSRHNENPPENLFINHVCKRQEKCNTYRKAPCLIQLGFSRTPSPHRACNCKTKPSMVSSNSWPSPRLSHAIEVDDNETTEEPRHQFFKIATVLDNRLEDMSFQASNLQRQTRNLKQAYEELDDTTNQLLTDVRHLTAQLKYIRNLDDLIRLLNGKTDHISSQKWPFVMAHSTPSNDLNLII